MNAFSTGKSPYDTVNMILDIIKIAYQFPHSAKFIFCWS